MFEEYFGLTAKPFGKTPDPAFLYESHQHKEALARLEYAVDEKELALLVGDIGSGKTMLSRALIDRVGESRPIVLLINPRLTPTQLLRAVARGLGLEPARFRNDLLDQIHTKLFELYEQQREPVLMIDEAQLIPTKATFDEIRLLTNFQLDDQNLLSVVLIGQPELENRLKTRRRSKPQESHPPRRSTASMVDLVKIRQKKAKKKEEEQASQRNAGVPLAGQAAL